MKNNNPILESKIHRRAAAGEFSTETIQKMIEIGQLKSLEAYRDGIVKAINNIAKKNGASINYLEPDKWTESNMDPSDLNDLKINIPKIDPNDPIEKQMRMAMIGYHEAREAARFRQYERYIKKQQETPEGRWKNPDATMYIHGSHMPGVMTDEVRKSNEVKTIHKGTLGKHWGHLSGKYEEHPLNLFGLRRSQIEKDEVNIKGFKNKVKNAMKSDNAQATLDNNRFKNKSAAVILPLGAVAGALTTSAITKKILMKRLLKQYPQAITNGKLDIRKLPEKDRAIIKKKLFRSGLLAGSIGALVGLGAGHKLNKGVNKIMRRGLSPLIPSSFSYNSIKDENGRNEEIRNWPDDTQDNI